MHAIFTVLTESDDYPVRPLIARLVQIPRNSEAWDEFFERFNPCVHRIVGAAFRKYRGCCSEGEVCDFTQNLYKRLLEHNGRALRQFRGKTGREFKSYLAQICYNLIHDARLKKPELGALVLDTTSGNDDLSLQSLHPTVEPDQERAVQRRELREFTAQHLRQLGSRGEVQRNRLIFVLRHLENRSAREVGAMLGIDPSVVDTVYHRIRKKIEANLADTLRQHKHKFNKLL